MEHAVNIIGGGLAGSEAALQLASRGVRVNLLEMRPAMQTPVHTGGSLAELVCSNSLKTLKPDKAAGMLKWELAMLDSRLLACACAARVPAGGALAVDRRAFSAAVESLIAQSPHITRHVGEAVSLDDFDVAYRDEGGDFRHLPQADALIIATGPLTSGDFAAEIGRITGAEHLAFYDAAAPIVMADSLDESILFRQSRYGAATGDAGDYLNAPLGKDEYRRFIEALLEAKRAIARDFEQRDLFSACQPIEEVARSGFDAPRHGMMKPVGLTDPRTGRRPWAAVQLRAEDAHGSCYNLVGFQTNLSFPEQRRVFRLIPGLEQAEFARYGVMHRNTFIDAPHLLDSAFRLRASSYPLYFAGQVAGTEGYCEAIMSGLYVALRVYGVLAGEKVEAMPASTAFGSLVRYATNPQTRDYQPMHVNLGVLPPLENGPRNKSARYRAFFLRERETMRDYAARLRDAGLLPADFNTALPAWRDALEEAGFSETPGE